jgi:hypothetical protein
MDQVTMEEVKPPKILMPSIVTAQDIEEGVKRSLEDLKRLKSGLWPRKRAMRTYVAEVNDEALIAFRAETDDDAYYAVNEEDGGVQLGLNGMTGVERVNGTPLWDGETEIFARRATQAEHEQWQKVLNSATGSAYEGKQIDPDFGDDPDDLVAYLIPLKPVDDEDDEAA